jgi:hypothetical protein
MTQVLDLSYKYGLKHTRKRCTEVFVTHRAEVLESNPDLATLVSNIPPLGLELLGIEPKNVKSVDNLKCTEN